MALRLLLDDHPHHPYYDPLTEVLSMMHPFGAGIHPEEFNSVAVMPRRMLPGGYHRNWAIDPHVKRSLKDMAVPTTTKDGFEVSMDVQHFQPNEITVKTVDNTIIIEGKHEEREDNHGFISRQFCRKYALPKGYDAEKVVSALSSDGVLTIKAPPPAIDKGTGERHIQIQQTGPALLNVKGPQNGDGDKDPKKKK